MPRILRITPEMAGVPAAAPLARQGDTPSPWPAVAKAATSLASTVETTGNQLIRIQNALKEEDAKLDAQKNFNELKLDIARKDAEIRAGIVMPEPGSVSASDMNGGVGDPSPPGPELLAGPEETSAVLQTTGAEQAAGPQVSTLPAPVTGAPLESMIAALQTPTAGGATRPPQPHQYAQTYDQALDQMVNDSVKRLKYPGTERQYRAQIAEFVGAQKVAALNRGIKLQHEQIMVTDALAAKDEARTVVYGTPEQAARAKASRKERLDRQLAGGLRDHGSYLAAQKDFAAAIEDGEIERDWRYGDANTKNALLGNLRAGRFTYLDPGAQQRRAHDLEQRDLAADQHRRTQQEADRKGRATEADKTIASLVYSNNYAGAREALQKAGPDLEAPRYEHWLKGIEDREAKGDVLVTDKATERRLVPLVYSPDANPRVASDALHEAWALRLVAKNDFEKWGAHLETKINRLQTKADAAANRAESRANRAQSDLHYETSQAHQRLREATRVDATLSPKLNLEAQDIYNQGLQDMDRNIKAGERPMDWIERNRPRIQGQLSQVGTTRVKTINQQLVSPTFPQSVASADTPQGIEQGKLHLQNELRAARTPQDRDKVMDRINLLNEKERVLIELQRFREARPSTGAAPTGAPAAAPKATPQPTPSGARPRPPGS